MRKPHSPLLAPGRAGSGRSLGATGRERLPRVDDRLAPPETRLEKARAAIVAVLEARGLHVPKSVAKAIAGCDDVETLDRWLRRAATAGADEVTSERRRRA